MIINKGRQTSMETTLKVQLDLNSRGWVVMRSEEECPYDLIVDMGLVEGKREFCTIQVKTNPRTSSRPSAEKNVESVSNNGKPRNNYWYYDEDVTLIASIIDNEVVYWHKDFYKYRKPSKFKNMQKYDFPLNNNMFSYRRPDSNEKSSLEDFFG